MTFTHIIVGAGAAGCVLAEGLSRRPEHRVLLIEAGPDYPDLTTLPPDLVDGTVPSLASHDWGIHARGPLARSMHLPRGKVVGGSSQTNSCIALRPEREDLDPLNGLDHPDWCWQRMLRCLVEIERDGDFSGPYHGASGPLPLRRPTDALTEISQRFLKAANALG